MTLLTVREKEALDLQAEVKNDFHIIYDYFGEKGIDDFLRKARNEGLDTNYECIDDIDALEELIDSLERFINKEYRMEHALELYNMECDQTLRKWGVDPYTPKTQWDIFKEIFLPFLVKKKM